MDKLTRRGFFKRATVGVATGSVLAATPAAFISVAETPQPAAAAELANNAEVPENVVAYVRNVANGEVALMYGTQEIVYRDPDLVAHIMRATR